MNVYDQGRDVLSRRQTSTSINIGRSSHNPSISSPPDNTHSTSPHPSPELSSEMVPSLPAFLMLALHFSILLDRHSD